MTELKKASTAEAAELARLRAAEVAREAEAAGAAAAAVSKSAMSAKLEADITKRIADAAKHNTTHTIAPPLVAAAIEASFHYARTLAEARRDGTWQASHAITEITFPLPPSSAPPDLGSLMAAGGKLVIVDWREYANESRPPYLAPSSTTSTAPLSSSLLDLATLDSRS